MNEKAAITTVVADGKPSERSDPWPGGHADTVFPLGVASGDPTDSTVILWTKVGDTDERELLLRYQVATDEAFEHIVVDGDASAFSEYDHTFRVKVTGLDPRRYYYYRFAYGTASSVVGRTKTAPAPDDDRPVRIGFASCQDYPGRSFQAWRCLVAEENPPDVVLFLGDYIYETDHDIRYQTSTPQRAVELPDGQSLTGWNDFKAARTLADYRALYARYKRDPDLREAHRLFPFIAMWDDHEFANDCWRDHTVYLDDADGDEKDTARREAATRAYYENLPLDVAYNPDAGYPDEITLYRSFRFGSACELFVMDQRYYRDDHAVGEGPVNLEVGKFGANTSLGSRILTLKEGFDRFEAQVAPTMLGEAQREWVTTQTQASAARWKLWASPAMMAQMRADLREFDGVAPPLAQEFYYKLDQWDGFRSERRALFEAVADVENLAVLSADLHAFVAADLYINFDELSGPIGPEYLVAGISSMSLYELNAVIVDNEPVLSGLGLEAVAEAIDETLTASNRHFDDFRSRAYGYAIADIGEDLKVTFVLTTNPTEEDGGVLERVTYQTKSGSRRVARLDND